MTVNLFPLYLMDFMFHTMLDAAGIVLRVHYQSMKCDVLFSQLAYVHYLGEVEIFLYMSKQIYSSLQQCKNLVLLRIPNPQPNPRILPESVRIRESFAAVSDGFGSSVC